MKRILIALIFGLVLQPAMSRAADTPLYQRLGGYDAIAAVTDDFLGRLATGHGMFGMSAYMFDPSTPRYLRALSLFHVPLPIGLVWLVHRLGYDRRAWLYQSLVALLVLPITYWVTDPAENVNWVHGLGRRQPWLHPGLYLALLIVAFALVLYLPPHLAAVLWPFGAASS